MTTMSSPPKPARPAPPSPAAALAQRKPAPQPSPAGAPDRAHVRCEKFSVYYGRKAAVKDVTVATPFGQVSAIIGPSGCGKSTLLRAINRMNDLIPICTTSGRLLLDDEDVYGPQVDVT